MDQERSDTLNIGFGPAATYQKDKPVFEYIAEIAQQYPDKIALSFEDRQMNYRHLDETSNRIAHILIAEGIKPGDVIGLSLDRSPEMIVSLLAIIKSGAAYIPLDPEYPADRIEFMLEDASAKILFTSKKYQGKFNTQSQELYIEDILFKLDAQPTTQPQVTVKGDDLIYILYTSGSTGKPKGVQIRHSNFANFILSMKEEPGLTADDVLLGVTTISFDIFGLEMYLPFIVGATLIITDTVTAKDGRALLEIMRTQGVTMMQATPYTWRMLIEAGWDKPLPVRVITGGEPLAKDLADKLIPLCEELWNQYGPTETTVYSTIKHVTESADITIGKPIWNTQIYILDEQNNNLTDGSVGEICIGGDSVAAGYLNRPELNEEKFIDDTFSGTPGGKVYRTGDLGSFKENGEVNCLGRIDHQVKIRGYRIELAEIEYILSKQKNVRSAVVLPRTDMGPDLRLVAYLVLEPNEEDLVQQMESWRQALADALPEYMVADDYAVIDEIPQTPNGKVDRKALPDPRPFIVRRREVYVEPRTTVEKLVADTWAEFMGLEQVGVYDDFFELGGRSLVAVKIMARLEQETGKRLPLATLFEFSTVEKLAQRLQVDGKSITWESLVNIKPKGTKMPIYIVHGAGLNVLLFNALAMNLDADQPVFGLQAKGLNGIDKPLDNMEEIAANYIAEIVAKNPDGPYALAGYSLGGIIAYEMARQMIEAGRDVRMVAMFDTHITQTERYDSVIVKLFRRTRLLIMQLLYSFVLLAQDPKRAIEYKALQLKRRIIRLWWRIKGADQSQEGFFGYSNELDEENKRAMDNYFVQPVNVAIDLFRAKKKTFYMDDFKFMGWKPYAKKGVRVHDIPGEHNTIFAPPNDQEFAVVLQKCLDEAAVKKD
ncbi:amino acid adenylation domain-containing protein [Mucilaginibacter yixingensis]|uniref:Amino acid adenylation domain-containing protein n=1 Tax=Mucilaginibacter yixingensis TaxID=1295612 RepID=A0A2T5JEU5_9SPHI|nr:non-ribosomal peptide synthetase [Mucilaginibacter yixingensis]PTR00939.1 amino acid adenylation domain-containing protein [Mucilaginibacter yixingensis]